MPLLLRTWLLAARARRRLGGRPAPREELVKRYAPNRTFVDVGCMWRVNGEIAFLAEESGATAVTGLDLMGPTPEFTARHERVNSCVRFVQGDLHEPATLEAVGVHDVVWCTGVLYHSPNPLLTLQRLHSITRQFLILATEAIPEVPGLTQAAIFLPGLPDPDRQAHADVRKEIVALGVSTPFAREQSYGAWWWELSRSAVLAMLRASGFETVEDYGAPFGVTVVARPEAAVSGRDSGLRG